MLFDLDPGAESKLALGNLDALILADTLLTASTLVGRDLW
jgi:hypothetical protein